MRKERERIRRREGKERKGNSKKESKREHTSCGGTENLPPIFAQQILIQISQNPRKFFYTPI
jgi:hypothetical protein